MRLSIVIMVLLGVLLAGCSGGSSSGANAQSGGVGNLALRIDARQLARQGRGIPTQLTIRVVDATDTELDVVAPVVIPITDESIVQLTITNIPAGQRRVRVQVVDEEGLPIGSALSDIVTVAPGILATLTVEVPFGPPPGSNRLSFRVQPTGTLVNQTLTPPIEVEVLDASGAPVPSSGQPITLSLASNPGSASLSGTLTVPTVNGVATFADLALTQPGNGYTFLASSPDTDTATSNLFDVAASVGPPAQLLFLTQPSNAAAGQFIAPPIQVVVQDAAGITVPTATNPVNLALGANPGATTLNGTVSVVPSNGVATFNDLHINVPAANYTLIASSTGLPDLTSLAFTITDPATQLAFGTQPGAGQARAGMNLFTVEIRDASGTLVATSNATVTVALASNPGPSTLSGTLSVAAVNGVASFNNVMLSKSGTGYTLQATATGLTPTTSNPFDQTVPRGFLLPVAGFPLALAGEPSRAEITPDGSFLYVARFLTFPGLVSGFSINSVTGALTPLGASPYTSGGSQCAAVRVSPDNTLAVATNAGGGNLTRFTIGGGGDLIAPANAATGANPLDMAIRQGITSTVYVANFAANTISAIDLTSLLPVAGSGTILSGAGTNQQVLLHPNNNLLILPTGDVFSVTPADGGITPVPFSPFVSAQGIINVIHPSGNFLFTGQTNQIAVHAINPATGFLTPIPGSPFAAPGDNSVMWTAFNGEFLYSTPDFDTNTHIYAIDPATGAITEIDDSPVVTGQVRGAAVSPFDTFVYTCDRFSNQLNAFSLVP